MNVLAQKIAEEIGRQGPMTVARFMEQALYEPLLGYYERHIGIGQAGDFFTSVSVGSLFGELLAFQFAEWANEVQAPDEPWIIVEAGAHDGRLTADILGAMKAAQPRLFSAVQYWIIEPSQQRQDWQRKTLQRFSDRTRWCKSLAEFTAPLADQVPFTVIFSNELLDAMPVHLLRWDAKEKNWWEWLISCKDGAFLWETGFPAAELKQYVPVIAHELAAVLPDGFTTEISPAAIHWWHDAAIVLKDGRLVTFDYGFSGEEFLQPQRSRGTLRAYSRHHANSDILSQPGEQDLTAHVNFSSLQAIGESAGLRTEIFCTQERFLTQIAQKTWLQSQSFPEWTPHRVKQFQTLTHPEHLGRPFRVLVQSHP